MQRSQAWPRICQAQPHVSGTKGPHPESVKKKTWALGVEPAEHTAETQPGSYHGLIGERVRVVDPLGGAVHVTRLARVHQRWNDLVMVLTAEELGLTRVQGNTWEHQQGKVNVRLIVADQTLEIISHLPTTSVRLPE